MPYQVEEIPEPLTERSRDRPSHEPSGLATSTEHSRLLKEIRRYLKCQIAGRSFLISGHRGSGKTTLVASAVEELIRVARDREWPARPLYVRLHGPDLLPRRLDSASKPKETPGVLPTGQLPPKANNESPTRADTKPASTKPDQGSPTKPDAATAPKSDGPANVEAQLPHPAPAEQIPCDHELDNVMKQIAIALYRAAISEFASSYRSRILNISDLSGLKKSELLEVAAQLSFELDDCPRLARLRQFWAKAGLLSSGVLFPSPRPDHPDQGKLELVTLAMACQAYQVVSGKWDEIRKQSDSVKHSSSLALATAVEVKNLLNPVISVVTGGAVGAVLLSQKVGPLAAVLAALASALVVSFSFNWSSSRSRDSSQQLDNTFSKDRSVGSLGRMLPLLVEQFRRIGLMPIFVVDELDKVDDLADRMRHLIQYLKFFVTERAFFCFLTDRNYMERLEQLTSTNTYAPEYTYFTDRLYVMYKPADLRRYLQETVKYSGQSSGNEDPSLDLPVLHYALLHRSRLHVFDLRREIECRTRTERLLPEIDPSATNWMSASSS